MLYMFDFVSKPIHWSRYFWSIQNLKQDFGGSLCERKSPTCLKKVKIVKQRIELFVKFMWNIEVLKYIFTRYLLRACLKIWMFPPDSWVCLHKLLKSPSDWLLYMSAQFHSHAGETLVKSYYITDCYADDLDI